MSHKYWLGRDGSVTCGIEPPGGIELLQLEPLDLIVFAPKDRAAALEPYRGVRAYIRACENADKFIEQLESHTSIVADAENKWHAAADQLDVLRSDTYSKKMHATTADDKAVVEEMETEVVSLEAEVEELRLDFENHKAAKLETQVEADAALATLRETWEVVNRIPDPVKCSRACCIGDMHPALLEVATA
jgi:hypothetical protein